MQLMGNGKDHTMAVPGLTPSVYMHVCITLQSHGFVMKLFWNGYSVHAMDQSSVSSARGRLGVRLATECITHKSTYQHINSHHAIHKANTLPVKIKVKQGSTSLHTYVPSPLLSRLLQCEVGSIDSATPLRTSLRQLIPLNLTIEEVHM